ncbi:hypothetical protein O9H85_27870 [Paenibacillus filicis]|uniref:Transcriptional regulator n=1 Tax=Paenibacillus gyeongsangnamensis TaxID=3388067 RepID=A0ABT4QH71_9BACL|nr:hypothetical protein [Paenibacillus filicis]MCZ8516148.1 hypothetical protein [Paenibacillus filicis]
MKQQQFRLLIVGPQDNVSQVLELGYMFQKLQLLPRPYHYLDEAVAILQKNEGKFDGVLFTGPIPYFNAAKVYKNKFPMVHIPFGGKALYRALFHAVQSQHPLNKISIDTIYEQEVSDTLNELGLYPEQVFCLQYNKPLTVHEFVDYHTRLYEQGKIESAFTCLQAAHLQLLERKVPVIRIMPPRSTIADTLEKASLMGETLTNQANQMVVIIIEAAPINEMLYTASELCEKQLELERSILNFAQEVEGSFTRSIRDQYMIATTREHFGSSAQPMTAMPFSLGALKSVFQIRIGVGIAGTASTAGYHAKISLQKSREQGENSCFICHPDKTIIGPIGVANPKTERLTVTEPILMELSGITGLSPILLERSIKTIAEMKLDRFTAYDIATQFGISARSARRLLQHLSSQQVIDKVGKELINKKGKPRIVFRLNHKFYQEIQRTGI